MNLSVVGVFCALCASFTATRLSVPANTGNDPHEYAHMPTLEPANTGLLSGSSRLNALKAFGRKDSKEKLPGEDNLPVGADCWIKGEEDSGAGVDLRWNHAATEFMDQRCAGDLVCASKGHDGRNFGCEGYDSYNVYCCAEGKLTELEAKKKAAIAAEDLPEAQRSTGEIEAFLAQARCDTYLCSDVTEYGRGNRRNKFPTEYELKQDAATITGYDHATCCVEKEKLAAGEKCWRDGYAIEYGWRDGEHMDHRCAGDLVCAMKGAGLLLRGILVHRKFGCEDHHCCSEAPVVNAHLQKHAAAKNPIGGVLSGLSRLNPLKAIGRNDSKEKLPAEEGLPTEEKLPAGADCWINSDVWWNLPATRVMDERCAGDLVCAWKGYRGRNSGCEDKFCCSEKLPNDYW